MANKLKTLLLAVLLFAAFNLPAKCLKFQNSISKTIYVAIAYHKNGGWISEGWWKLPPGSTKVVLSGHTNTSIYWHATIEGEYANYSGDYCFCVDPVNGFTKYFAEKLCVPENERGFRKMDIGNCEDFTINVNSESYCAGNCENGIGTYYYSNGTYKGSWKNGKKNGSGVYRWKSGDVYDGSWVNDLKEGKGTYTWANGKKYVGEFVAGIFHGHGTMTYANGEKLSGIWENDIFKYYGELHLFLVMNTTDPNVGFNAKRIKQNLYDLYKQIASVGQFKFRTHIIDGTNFYPEYIKNRVNAFKCHESDIVVFHYFGHGGRLSSTTSKWPLLQCSNTQSLSDCGIPLEWFKTNLYYRSSAKLGLFFADCCNYQYGNLPPCVPVNKVSLSSPAITQSGVKKLFQRKGSLLASSSSPNQASYPWDEKESSFYNVYFINSMLKGLGNSSLDWEDILSNVHTEVKTLTGDCQLRFGIQAPQHESFISK